MPLSLRLGDEAEKLVELAEFYRRTQAEQIRALIREEHARLERTPLERWHAALRELAIAAPPEES